MSRFTIAILFTAICCSLSGCKMPEPVLTDPRLRIEHVDPLGGVPLDLTIDVQIRAGREYPPRDEMHLRPGRFVVLPDGSLRHDRTIHVSGDRLPGHVRTLDRQRMARLWATATHLGLTDPDLRPPVGNPELIVPQREGLVCSVTFFADGSSWTWSQHISAEEDLAPALRSFVRQVAQLAWLHDGEIELGRTLPRRYDHGPDPYERYR